MDFLTLYQAYAAAYMGIYQGRASYDGQDPSGLLLQAALKEDWARDSSGEGLSKAAVDLNLDHPGGRLIKESSRNSGKYVPPGIFSFRSFKNASLEVSQMWCGELSQGGLFRAYP